MDRSGGGEGAEVDGEEGKERVAHRRNTSNTPQARFVHCTVTRLHTVEAVATFSHGFGDIFDGGMKGRGGKGRGPSSRKASHQRRLHQKQSTPAAAECCKVYSMSYLHETIAQPPGAITVRQFRQIDICNSAPVILLVILTG